MSRIADTNSSVLSFRVPDLWDLIIRSCAE